MTGMNKLKGIMRLRRLSAVLRSVIVYAVLCPFVPSALAQCFSYGRLAGRNMHHSVRLPQRIYATLFFVNPLRKVIFTMLFFMLTATSALALPPGTVVSNTASLTYVFGSTSSININSNPADFTIVAYRTDALIDFMQYAPSNPSAELLNISNSDYDSGGGVFVPMADPVPFGTTSSIDLTSPVPLLPSNAFHAGEVMFVKLTDLDQNHDATLIDTLIVSLTNGSTGDVEVLQLYEAGINTGIFVGYIKTTNALAITNSGLMSVVENSIVNVSYTDDDDNTDTEAAAALVDPFGIVFDSGTGAPVDGVLVTLIDAATGLPATVFGDDGVSIYPASIITGTTATDSGGNVYNFQPGLYRFPFVYPGNYRLDVTPPGGYLAPSTVSTATLQALPGAPFAIVNPGSRGEVFVVNPGPALHIDYPVDPLNTGLYLKKNASKEFVSHGDFLQYKIEVLNGSAADVTNAVVTDKLPIGFRYMKGSLNVNSIIAPDPTISSDGRVMTIKFTTLTAGSSTTISYVTEVGAGAEKGESINRVSASGDGGATSNVATAAVAVKEDFFRSETIITGRIMLNACGEYNEEISEGVSGIRVFMEDGTFVMSDKKGMFHFKGVSAGTHVVQLDIDSIPPMYEIVTCEENSRLAGRNYSRFVDLQGGTLWRTDFYLGLKPRAKGEVIIKLNSILQADSEEADDDLDMEEMEVDEGNDEKDEEQVSKGDLPGKDTVHYRLPIEVGKAPLKNLRLTVILPDGASYIKESSFADGDLITDPVVFGSSMTYRLGNVKPESLKELNFSAEIPRDGQGGEILTRAMLTVDTMTVKNIRTAMLINTLIRHEKGERTKRSDIILHPHFESFGVTLTDKDKLMLDDIIGELKSAEIVHIFFNGHTDNKQIVWRSKHIFADNFELSRGRAKSVAAYMAQQLDLPPEKITIDGTGEDEPIASNLTEEGRELNRRVELKIVSNDILQSAYLIEAKTESDVEKLEIQGLRPGEEWEDKGIEEKISGYEIAIQDNSQGLAWIWPKEGEIPSNYYIRVAIKHDPDDRVTLYQEGEEIHPIAFQGVKRAKGSPVAISTWRGVILREGSNRLEAVLRDNAGNIKERLIRDVYYAGLPVSAELIEDKSALVSDGMKGAVIAVRLLDKGGNPVRNNFVGEFTIDPPFMPIEAIKGHEKNPVTGPREKAFKYKVGDNGIVMIKLAPSTKSGEFLLRLRLSDGEKHVRGWISPEMRDWILVGFAEGTAGYSMLDGNKENLESKGVDEDLYTDGRVAFYAKGRIKGNILLTMAYDSNKKNELERERLHQTLDPDKYYTLYGDGSEQRHDAASARALYLRIEGEKFYALFGDFNTGLTVTDLSRYNRSMNGFKSEMKGRNIEYNVHASETTSEFRKDELRGDGTSGLYHLAKNNVVVNSESVEIEVRDRFRSEVVISSRKLNRYLDYSIDYDEGTIYFREPVYSTDGNFNPIYVVVDYETNDSSEQSLNYGGRVALKLFDNKVVTGFSNVHEGTPGGGEGDLYGVDMKLKLTKGTYLKAEAASSESDYAGVNREGRAYLAEINHTSDLLSSKLYFRKQGAGFGLGQQRGSEYGMEKVGIDGKYSVSKETSLQGDIFRQTNLLTEAYRDYGAIKAIYVKNKHSISAGLRDVTDNFADGSSYNSRHLDFGGKLSLLGDGLNVRYQREQALIGRNENHDYPSRTVIGADYKLSGKTSLFIDEEFTDGGAVDSESTRVGFKATPWSGGDWSSSLDRRFSENGTRIFSNLGLKQTVRINDRWKLDGGINRVETLKDETSKSITVNVPAASGAREDFTALTLGIAYQRKKWSFTSRIESRDADNSDKLGLFAGAHGETKEGLGLALGLKTFRSVYTTGIEKFNADLNFSVASRTRGSKWIVLERLDLIYKEEKGGDFNFDNSRIVNNLNTNYKHDLRTMFAFQYGAKYVKDTIDELDYSGYTDLLGIEGRYDITKKVDFGLRWNMLHSWSSESYDYCTGLSAGYNFAENIWASLGYNFTGFHDSDFSKGNYTAEGPYIKFRIKFDQQSVRELVKGPIY